MGRRGKRVTKRMLLDRYTIRTIVAFVILLVCAGYCEAQKSSNTATQQTFWIVFERVDTPELSLAYFPSVDIFIMNQNGHQTRRLTSNHRSHSPSWSSDGQQIAFLTDERAPLATATSDPDYDAFMQFRDFLTISHDVFRMDADGRNPKYIVSVEPEVQDVLLFPDGERIGVMVSDRSALRVVVDISGAFLQAVVHGEPLNEYLNAAQPLLSGAYDPNYSELRV